MATVDVRRIDHVSFTVGDLERSIGFYRQFGLEPIKSYRSEGPDAEEGTGTENASIDIAWLGLDGDATPMLELLRYRGQPVERAVSNSRVGAAHVCFAVNDIYTAYSRLHAEGVVFVSEPHTDAAGTTWVYMRDPDGNVVEMIEDPAAASGR
jgi:catechol 2,3-dioxygenase-like lactoylglutathione lyase family enzyme